VNDKKKKKKKLQHIWIPCNSTYVTVYMLMLINLPTLKV
jgi:hypothetical protein